MTPGGEAVVAWKHFDNPPGRQHDPGGDPAARRRLFSAPVTRLHGAADGASRRNSSVAIGDDGDRRRHLEPDRPRLGLRQTRLRRLEPNSVLCPNPSFVMASVRPAGGSLHAGARSRPARRRPAARPERKRRTGKSRIGAEARGGARPVDRRGRQRDRRLVVLQRRRQTSIQTAIRPRGRRASRAPVQISASGEDAGVAGRSASTPPATRSRSGLATNGADSHRPGRRPSPRAAASRRPATSRRPGEPSRRPGASASTPDGARDRRLAALRSQPKRFLQSATRPPGGAFVRPVNVSNSGKDNPLFHEIAVERRRATRSSSGRATTAPTRSSGRRSRPAGGGLRQPGGDLARAVRLLPSAGLDGRAAATRPSSGSATTAPTTSSRRPATTPTPPQLRDVSIPCSGTVGEPRLQFSALALRRLADRPAELRLRRRRRGRRQRRLPRLLGARQLRGRRSTAEGRRRAGRRRAPATIAIVKARNFFTIGKLKLNRKKGTATLTVNVPGTGHGRRSPARGSRRRPCGPRRAGP